MKVLSRCHSVAFVLRPPAGRYNILRVEEEWSGQKPAKILWHYVVNVGSQTTRFINAGGEPQISVFLSGCLVLKARYTHVCRGGSWIQRGVQCFGSHPVRVLLLL